MFDVSTFTIDGKTMTKGLVDMDGDFVDDEEYNAVFDGYYHEQYFTSAPQFKADIDGIIWNIID